PTPTPCALPSLEQPVACPWQSLPAVRRSILDASSPCRPRMVAPRSASAQRPPVGGAVRSPSSRLSRSDDGSPWREERLQPGYPLVGAASRADTSAHVRPRAVLPQGASFLPVETGWIAGARGMAPPIDTHDGPHSGAVPSRHAASRSVETSEWYPSKTARSRA